MVKKETGHQTGFFLPEKVEKNVSGRNAVRKRVRTPWDSMLCEGKRLREKTPLADQTEKRLPFVQNVKMGAETLTLPKKVYIFIRKVGWKRFQKCF